MDCLPACGHGSWLMLTFLLQMFTLECALRATPNQTLCRCNLFAWHRRGLHLRSRAVAQPWGSAGRQGEAAGVRGRAVHFLLYLYFRGYEFLSSVSKTSSRLPYKELRFSSSLTPRLGWKRAHSRSHRRGLLQVSERPTLPWTRGTAGPTRL